MDISKRKKHIQQVFDTLEQNHVNLYRNISKQEFERLKNHFAEKSELLSDEQFEYGMLRLFHLFFDAHTFYLVDFDVIELPIIFQDQKMFLLSDGICREITHVNDRKTEEVTARLKEIISYETEEWAFCKLARKITSPKALRMIGMSREDNSLELKTAEGEVLLFDKSYIPYNTSVAQKTNQSLYYGFEKINDSLVYVRYKACKNSEEYPFFQFVQDVKAVCGSTVTKCLVDVRGNAGGSSTVIHPLLKWLSDEKIATYVLMNRRTFSGGCFAVADLKRYANAVLLGTPCGQPTRRFGECRKAVIDDYTIGYSNKYFDFAAGRDAREGHCCYFNVFDYDGAITPDVLIKQDLKAYAGGVDRQLQEAIRFCT